MGRSLCQRCGTIITKPKSKFGTSKRKTCWKFCKLILKHVVAEIMDDEWVSDLLGEAALHHKRNQNQPHNMHHLDDTAAQSHLCHTCMVKAVAEAEAEAEAAANVAKRVAEAAMAAAAAVQKEAEARACRLMLIINGCFVCVFMIVCLYAWSCVRG
ncbi:unnamed protein product [Amaranthus hypochondriacus]